MKKVILFSFSTFILFSATVFACNVCFVKNIDCPTSVKAGEKFNINFEFVGTGPEYPYEYIGLIRDGENVFCKQMNKEECQWNKNTVTTIAPSQPGIYTYSVRCYSAASISNDYCGMEDDSISCKVDVTSSKTGMTGFFVLTSSETSIDKYPGFLKDSLVDVVTGKYSSNGESIGAADIYSSLNISEVTKKIKLDSEITSSDKIYANLILVGTPCTNSLIKELSDAGKFRYSCENWPNEEFGIIEIIDNAFALGKSAIIIGGYKDYNTRLACTFLSDSNSRLKLQNYLSGLKAVKITGYDTQSASISSLLPEPQSKKDFKIYVKTDSSTYTPDQKFEVFVNSSIGFVDCKINIYYPDGTFYSGSDGGCSSNGPSLSIDPFFHRGASQQFGTFKVKVVASKSGYNDASAETSFVVYNDSSACKDSDGGKNYYVKGYVIDSYLYSKEYDLCYPDKVTLKEKFCDNGKYNAELYKCPNGCKDGACVEDTSIIPITPICSNVGTEKEAWTQNDNFMRYANCAGCVAICSSDGWRSSCDNSIIAYEKCGEVTDQVKCKQQGTSCCIGDECSLINSDCPNGITPVFKGCSEKCTPIWECNSKKTCDEECLKEGYLSGSCRSFSTSNVKDVCSSGEFVLSKKSVCDILENGKEKTCCCKQCKWDSQCPKTVCDCKLGQDCNCPQSKCVNGRCVEEESQCKSGEIKKYECPDGREVEWCHCDEQGWECINSPEVGCQSDKDTCKDKCKIYGYSSGICRSWAVIPNAEIGCKENEFEVGSTFDCNAKGIIGSGKTCCCSEKEKCSSKFDCPNIECVKAPCPEYKCKNGECILIQTCKLDSDCPTMESDCVGPNGIGGPCPTITFKCVNGQCVEKHPIECDDGCVMNDKCYPLGYRKAGQFCSEDNKFINQYSEGTNCNNSFECSSNVCVNNECISAGLMQKIINWFANLFR